MTDDEAIAAAAADDAVISLLIVDDHPVVRDGLRGMFESAPGFRVLGEAAEIGRAHV